MEAVTNNLDRKGAHRLVKDDHTLLKGKVHNVLINIQVPGSLSSELEAALDMTTKSIVDVEEVEEKDLENAIRQFVTLAHYTRVIIDNSLISGDMLLEVYDVYTMCRYLEDRWLEK